MSGGNLHRHLRRGGHRYRRFGARFDFTSNRAGPVAGRVDISQRPAIVEKKSRVGDVEAILGANECDRVVRKK